MHKPVVVRLIGELRHEVHTFVRQEAELIKAEFREKTAHYREGSVVAAGGGVAVYAAFIVCLTGLGFLLSCLFERLRLDRPAADVEAVVLSAVRQGDGRWSVVVEVRGLVHVGDGRQVVLDRQINMNCPQRGRKPPRNKKAKE